MVPIQQKTNTLYTGQPIFITWNKLSLSYNRENKHLTRVFNHIKRNTSNNKTRVCNIRGKYETVLFWWKCIVNTNIINEKIIEVLKSFESKFEMNIMKSHTLNFSSTNLDVAYNSLEKYFHSKVFHCKSLHKPFPMTFGKIME